MIFVGIREDLDIDPRHPKPKNVPIKIKSILPSVKALRSQRINPWIFSDKSPPTLCKTAIGYQALTYFNKMRKLSIDEARVIGSFPETFVLKGSYLKQWARIGNSVPPNFMRAIAECVYETLNSRA